MGQSVDVLTGCSLGHGLAGGIQNKVDYLSLWHVCIASVGDGKLHVTVGATEHHLIITLCHLKQQTKHT